MNKDDEPENNEGKKNNHPDYTNQENSYLTAILKIDLQEETGKINYDELFAERDRRRQNGK